jgi:hypothetical protein
VPGEGALEGGTEANAEEREGQGGEEDGAGAGLPGESEAGRMGIREEEEAVEGDPLLAEGVEEARAGAIGEGEVDEENGGGWRRTRPRASAAVGAIQATGKPSASARAWRPRARRGHPLTMPIAMAFPPPEFYLYLRILTHSDQGVDREDRIRIRLERPGTGLAEGSMADG